VCGRGVTVTHSMDIKTKKQTVGKHGFSHQTQFGCANTIYVDSTIL